MQEITTFLFTCPTGFTIPHFSFPGGAPGNKQAGLGVAGLDRVVCSLIDRGIAESTLRSYVAGKKCYLMFCSQYNCHPLPVTDAILLRFTVHLASLGCHTKQLVCTCVLYATFKLFITYLIPPWHLTPC